MQARFEISKNDVSPFLARALKHVADKRPLLEAGALAIVSRAQGAFSDPSLRPSPWAPTKSKNPPLRKSGMLAQSIKVATVTNDYAIVGTSRKYAVFHQLGTKPYVIRAKGKRALFWKGAKHPVKAVNHPGLPARPFFPIKSGKIIPAAQKEVTNAVARTLARGLGVPPETFL